MDLFQGSGGFSNILSLAMQRIWPQMWWRIWRKNRNIREDDVESLFVQQIPLNIPWISCLLFVPLGWQHFYEALHAIWNGIWLVTLITHAFIKKTRYPKFSNISTTCSTGFFSLSPFCHLATFARYSFGLGYGLSMTANAGLAPLVAKLEKRTIQILVSGYFFGASF